MTDKTLERIEDDARKYAKTHSSAPDKETPTWIITDFTAGAKSERNKVLDDAISDIESYCLKWKRRLPSDLEADLIKILQSLKL